ncbi:hypothetical protein PFISCL1PPCAC_25747, partial [Pristionchus fissidentatus]
VGEVSVVITRQTGKYITLLFVESAFGLSVALSNILVIVILLAGWRRLMKNPFYVILSNLILCASMKGFVELGFILPYYIMQKDSEKNLQYYFSTEYERFIFNLSIFADYGILFFSVVIALNRLVAVTSSTSYQSSRVKTLLFCVVTWICAGIIPVFYFISECQYYYVLGVSSFFHYIIECNWDATSLIPILNILVYLSYAITVMVLILYLMIFIYLEYVYQKF